MPLDIVEHYREPLEKYGFVPMDHDAPNNFPVELVAMKAGKIEVEGWKALVRTDTNQVLHCWQDGYNLVPHEVATAAFDGAIAKSGLNTDGMHVATDLSHDGRRLFRQYLLPGHQIEVTPGDHSALRIVGFNSYDGSLAVSWRGGAYRFVCANTSLIGKDIAKVRALHKAGLDMDALAEGMVTACGLYLKEADRWQVWAAKLITTTLVVKLLKELPGVSDALIGELSQDWIAETAASQGEGTLWTFYNVLTSWASHGEVKGGNIAFTKLQRQERIARLVDAKEWKVLEDA